MMWSIFSLFLLSFVFKSDHKISLDDTIFIKVYVMMYWMFCNVWSISPCFDIPDMFFLTSFKTLASFVYTTPIKFSTRYFTFGWCLVGVGYVVWICGKEILIANSWRAYLQSSALQANNYPLYAIFNILKHKISKPPTHAISTPEELVCMFFKWAAPWENLNSLAVLPFINGVTQSLTRILRGHNIWVVN